MSKNPGTVDIHGKEYKTVALRVDEFRNDHPEWTINPTIVEADERIVVMRCEIRDEEGRLRAAGQAEENRTDGKINRTSAMENCETSAVGRALAFLGYAGSEIASADEVANSINSKPINRQPKKNDDAERWRNSQLKRIEQIADDGQRCDLEKRINVAADTGNEPAAAKITAEIDDAVLLATV